MAFLLRRDATYHFRCRIPTDLIDRFGRAEVKRSLDTTDRRAAKTLAARSYAAAQAYFDQVRKAPVDDKDKLIAELQATLKQVTEQLAVRTGQFVAATEALHTTTAKLEEVTTEYGQLTERNGALVTRYTEQVEQFDIVMDAVDGLGELLEDSNLAVKGLLQERKLTESAGKIQHAKETIGHLGDLLGHLGVVMASTPAPTILDFLNTTFTEEKRLQDDANRHIVNYVTMFARIAGNRPMNTYKRRDVISWVRTLEQIKNTIGKSPKDAEKSIKQLIAESRGRPTLGETTLDKHVQHVKAMFMMAIKHHRFAHPGDIDDMFDGIDYSEWVPKEKKRKSWTIEQLNGLLTSPIWAGTRSRKEKVTRRHLPGTEVYRDAYWWLPILALWTGARLEELAQLETTDLDHDVNGIPYIKINDEGDKRVKTENSVRNIPVHSFLVSLGFLDKFNPDAQRKRRIFPDLKPSGRLNKLGDTYSTHFTDYRRKTGLYEPLRDFHSLRRTFITTLRTKYHVHPLTVAQLAGHDQEDNEEMKRVQQTEDYTDYDIGGLSRVIETLDYPALGLDVSNLLKAV